MHVIYKKIVKDFKDKNIILSISSKQDTNKNSFEFQNYIDETIEEVVNPIIDGDTIIFKSQGDVRFNFYLYENSYANDILNSSVDKFQKATFFIVKFFSDVEGKKLLFKETIKLKDSLTVEYNNNNVWCINIPNIIKNNTIYAKFLFYNGKTGKVLEFTKNNNGVIIDILNDTIPLSLDHTNKNFSILQSYNLYQILNLSYNERIQNNVNVLPIKTNITPIGDKFYVDDDKITFNNG